MWFCFDFSLVEPLYDFVVQNYIMDGFRFFQFLTAFESSSILEIYLLLIMKDWS